MPSKCSGEQPHRARRHLLQFWLQDSLLLQQTSRNHNRLSCSLIALNLPLLKTRRDSSLTLEIGDLPQRSRVFMAAFELEHHSFDVLVVLVPLEELQALLRIAPLHHLDGLLRAPHEFMSRWFAM